MVSAVYLTRLVVGLTIPTLPLTVPAWYLPLSGAVWGLLALATAAGLYTGRTWAPLAFRLGGALYLAWYWLDRLLLARTDYALRTIPSSVFLTLLAVLVSLWVLRRSSFRAYFRENAT